VICSHASPQACEHAWEAVEQGPEMADYRGSLDGTAEIRAAGTAQRSPLLPRSCRAARRALRCVPLCGRVVPSSKTTRPVPHPAWHGVVHRPLWSGF